MKQIGLRLPEELVEEIEQVRGDVPRERWIRRAIIERLDNELGRCVNVDTGESDEQPS